MARTRSFSPMMKQYFQIKKEYQDCILFFRLGDFYEMFFEDAKLASQELELTLTGRDCGQEERAPMCGVPYHSSEAYIARLIEKGYKVAICEQNENAKDEDGLVAREVIRIITPGTVVESSMLQNEKNNYICTIYIDALGCGMCCAEITTGEVDALEITSGEIDIQIMTEIGKYLPREVIMNISAEENPRIVDYIGARMHTMLACGRSELFDEYQAKEALEEQFKTTRFKSLGFPDKGRQFRAVGAMFSYLRMTQKRDLSHMQTISFYNKDAFMQLDNAARRNLELCETLREKEKRGTLLWVLDKTHTAMGGRLLRRWIDNPLINVPEIMARQDAVAALYDATVLRGELSDTLKSILDIERLCGRTSYGIANGRDLKALEKALEVLPDLKELLAPFSCAELFKINGQIDPLDDVRKLIREALVDEPPVNTREGNLIRPGYHSEVDELRDILSGGKNFIAKIELEEREKTGIRSLKVGYNRVFGYYIEVSKSAAPQVPEYYTRKQTLTNSERFITPELKQMEGTMLNAQERLTVLEGELFRQLCRQIGLESGRMRITAQAISKLDVLVALAECAAQYHYVRPTLDENDVIEIHGGRHPVVERMLTDTQFVPNDTLLDCGENRMAIITGPNMAGKSTYMRQTALICLMAQMGAFVPADSAHIGVVDKIFTRIGASDDLAAGQSTFMVEMSEVANIIKNATVRSLLILDEIGRGTSTFDGMSIARAVIEYASDPKRIGAKTMFATHYHELTELEGQIPGVKNYNIAVKKQGFDITFLRKIVRGSADESYGIEVAKLAGLPESVIHRSKEILDVLEHSDPLPTVGATRVEYETNPQIAGLLARMRGIDINSLTPLDAQRMLHEIICDITKLED